MSAIILALTMFFAVLSLGLGVTLIWLFLKYTTEIEKRFAALEDWSAFIERLKQARVICTKPPKGWECLRPNGHEGPCGHSL